jgi:hypothetical protein
MSTSCGTRSARQPASVVTSHTTNLLLESVFLFYDKVIKKAISFLMEGKHAVG